jgi:hypothetical protein
MSLIKYNYNNSKICHKFLTNIKNVDIILKITLNVKSVNILINYDVKILPKSFKWSIEEAKNNKTILFSQLKSCLFQFI